MTDEELIARLRMGEDMHVLAADRIEALVKERDEADRRAGAAERSLESDRETLCRLGHWRDRQKEARGYPHTISFDVVWTETCAKADRAKAAEAKLVKAVEALQIAKSLMDTPIARRRLNLDPNTDERLIAFRAALAELDGK